MDKQKAIEALQTIDQLAANCTGLTVRESIKLVASIQEIGRFLSQPQAVEEAKGDQ